MPLSIDRAVMYRPAVVVYACAVLAVIGCYHQAVAHQGLTAIGGQTEEPPVGPTEQRAAPRFRGVYIVPTQAGGFLVQIIGGFAMGRDPLYIIDGNPIVIDRNRGIDWFKASDIADLKVLKDLADTAAYGPRGVNGVVLITTKQAAARR